jgi:uncharacterized protein YjbI with pentapeptide repeats
LRTKVKKLENITIKNETLVVDDDLTQFWGPNLTLEGCEIKINCTGKNLIINELDLINCNLFIKKLKKFDWNRAKILNCKFTGSIIEQDFGSWSVSEGGGSIENADFSEAELDGCRFINTDVGKIKFPSFPMVVIPNPSNYLEQSRNLIWDGKAKLFSVYFDESPEVSASVIDINKFIRKFDLQLSQLETNLSKLNIKL